MRFLHLAAAVTLAAGMVAMASARDVPQSGPAEDGSPAWFIDHAPEIRLRTYEDMCKSDTAKFCSEQNGQALRSCLSLNKARVSPMCQAALAAPWQGGGFDTSRTPSCERSVICAARPANNPDGLNGGGGIVARVEWKSEPPNMGYRAIYPYALPPGGGGATAVSMDSRNNLWAFQRVPPGMPELFKFGPDRKLIFALGDKEIGAHQDKAHGIRVDAEDNVWI